MPLELSQAFGQGVGNMGLLGGHPLAWAYSESPLAHRGHDKQRQEERQEAPVAPSPPSPPPAAAVPGATLAALPAMGSPEFCNMVLFIALGIFAVFIIDRLVQSVKR